MSTGELLGVDPSELRFPFELKKQISCSLQLSNKTDENVAYKIKTTNPKKYCVRPNAGVIRPRSTCDVIVMMQSQKEAPIDMQCKDKFLVQGVVASSATSLKDVTPELFSKEAGNNVEEFKLRVVYVSPPRPPSPVREGSEEDSSPRPSLSENGTLSSSERAAAARGPSIPPEKSTESLSLISKLTEEKNSVVVQNNQLRQELEMLRRKSKGGGFSPLFVALVALLGVILGYLFGK
ncbi:vesicle-associated protein 1-2-like [Wolffia australiana]